MFKLKLCVNQVFAAAVVKTTVTNLFLSLQQNPLYSPDRCCAFQCDLTKDDLRENVPEGSVDVVTLVFVLSAIHPDKMKVALKNIGRVRAVTALLKIWGKVNFDNLLFILHR